VRRPGRRAGRRRSGLRQKFHGWLHRRLVTLTESKAEEAGLAVVMVNPRGTSSFAFDGSGKVRRDDENHAWATFSSGKRYNCDLSASYNIGARYWAKKTSGRKRLKTLPDKRSGSAPRMPVTLSTLWSPRGVAEGETPTTSALAV
jgi:putative transposase